jgi:hypothetical protein
MHADEVWAALAVGAVSSVGLLIGVIAGAFSRIPHRRIAIAMSVGAGLLLAGVSLKVTADAIRLAGPIAVALSLLLGAAAFSASNALLARFGVRSGPARSSGPRRADHCVLPQQHSRRFIEHSGHAGGGSQLPLRLSALDCDRDRGSGRNCGRVCWIWFARWDVATSATGVWSRRAARDGRRNDDSRSLPQ